MEDIGKEKPEGHQAFRKYKIFIGESAGGQLDIGHGDLAEIGTYNVVCQSGFPELVCL